MMIYEWRDEAQTVLAGWDDQNTSYVYVYDRGTPEFDALIANAKEIRPWTPPTAEEIEANLAAEIREQRNALIAETDWTQASDVPDTTREKWQPYRQALRDVPQQEGFPHEVEWPEEP